MAVPVFESLTTVITNGVTWTGQKPSGTAENDLLLAHLTFDQVAVVNVVPSGWSLLVGPLFPVGNDCRLFLYTKVAGGSEPTEYTWTTATTRDEGALVLMRVSGIDTAIPIDDTVTSVNDDNSSPTHASATMTTTVADTLALFFCSADESSAKTRPYWTPIGGMTTEYDFEGDSFVYAGCYSETISSPASVQRTATSSNSDTSAMVLTSVRPGGAAPPTPSPPIGSLASIGVGR